MYILTEFGIFFGVALIIMIIGYLIETFGE